MAKDEIPRHTRILPTLSGSKQIPSEKEREALMALKTIKDRVRVLKLRLAELSDSDFHEEDNEMLKLEKELARLKTDWNEWDKRRQMASRERMIALGHEEGPL